MIKCGSCGANLQIDNAFCPYCGTKNPYFEKHRQEMNEYKQEFNETKDNVYTHTKKFTSATVSITIICVLVVLNLVMLFVAANSWKIYDRYQESKIERNYKEIKLEMDQLIEQEDFLEFYELTYQRYSNVVYFSDTFREYTKVAQTAASYSQCYAYIMDYVAQDYYNKDNFNNDLSYLCDEIMYLEKRSTKREYEEENAFTPDKVKAMESMKKEIQLLLKTYIGLTDEEVAGIYEMDKVDLMVLLKENMTYVDEDAE